MVNKWVEDKNEPFKIDGENLDVINALILYWANSPKFEELPYGPTHFLRSKPKLSKGLYLVGNVGSGKTLLMSLFKMIPPPTGLNKKKVILVPTDEITDKVRSEGVSATNLYKRNFDQYQTELEYIFDDLAAEDKAKYYGDILDPMYDIISKRYRIFDTWGIKTHFTTNVSLDELKEYYDSRIESRVAKMVNVIVLGGSMESKDRRR